MQWLVQNPMLELLDRSMLPSHGHGHGLPALATCLTSTKGRPIARTAYCTTRLESKKAYQIPSRVQKRQRHVYWQEQLATVQV